MRVSYLIIAATAVAATTTPAASQGLKGIARGVLQSTARDLANKPIPLPTIKKTEPDTKSAPTPEDAQSAPQSAPQTPSEGAIVVAEDMPVITSDGARVAVVKHTTTGGTNYAPDKTFFTADPYYRLRRIYGREATVRGGAVHLKMTAAQYRARGQNPDD